MSRSASWRHEGAAADPFRKPGSDDPIPNQRFPTAHAEGGEQAATVLRNGLRAQEEADGDWEFFTDDDDNKLVGLKSNSAQPSKVEFEEIVSRVREKYPNHLFLKIQELVPIILEIADGALTKNALIKAILEIRDSANFEEIGLPGEISEYLNHNQDEYLLAERKEHYLQIIWAEIRTFPAHLRKVWL